MGSSIQYIEKLVDEEGFVEQRSLGQYVRSRATAKPTVSVIGFIRAVSQ